MNKIKIIRLIFISLMLLYSFLMFIGSAFSKEVDSLSTIRRNSFEISISPRYSNVIFKNIYNYNKLLNHEYIDGYVFMNYNINYYNNLKKGIFLDLGFSFLHYGDKQNHVAAFVDNIHGVSYYDSISILEKYLMLAVPIGIVKEFYNNKINFKVELGLINNYFISYSTKSLDFQYQSFSNWGVIFIHDYFASAYLKAGVALGKGNTQMVINSIFNYTPYNLYPFNLFPHNDNAFVKLYQIGLDFGIRFNFK